MNAKQYVTRAVQFAKNKATLWRYMNEVQNDISTVNKYITNKKNAIKKETNENNLKKFKSELEDAHNTLNDLHKILQNYREQFNEKQNLHKLFVTNKTPLQKPIKQNYNIINLKKNSSDAEKILENLEESGLI
jgi:predicted  nucleic acid-binding Zn-ribbon protein